MAIEIVDFPIKNGGSFHSFLYVDQAGYPQNIQKNTGLPSTKVHHKQAAFRTCHHPRTHVRLAAGNASANVWEFATLRTAEKRCGIHWDFFMAIIYL